MTKNVTDKIIGYSFLVVSLIALGGCIQDLTQKNIVYANDFEKGDTTGILFENFFGPIKYNKIINYNGSNVLGTFNNTRFTIKLDSLPEHNTISVEFILNIHDKWEGDHVVTNNTPDLWVMKFNDNPVLITTFSNTSFKQSYPNFYPSPNPYPAKGNAFDIGLPGLCSLKGVLGGTSSYRIIKTVPHDGSKFKFDCSDALQPFNDSCAKSWSIDNLTIAAIKY